MKHKLAVLFAFLGFLCAAPVFAKVWNFDEVTANDIKTKGPEVDVRAYASLAAAVADAGTSGKTILIPSGVSASSLTVPATRSIRILRGGSITLTGTNTINGPFEAPRVQVFSGAGTVAFGQGAIRYGLPEWWGAAGDGVTDDKTAIDKMYTAIGDRPALLLGTSYIYDGGALVSPSGIGYSITKKLNTARPSAFVLVNDSAYPRGTYRAYTTTLANQATHRIGEVYNFDVNAIDAGGTSRTNVGLSVDSTVSSTEVGPHQFAWHNIQSYAESEMEVPAEIDGFYVFAHSTNGATPIGTSITAVADGANKPNHLWGIQLKTVDNADMQVSSKAVSVAHLGTYAADDGIVVWGRAGYVNALRITNGCDRNVSECFAYEEGGTGAIDNAIVIESVGWNLVSFTSGGTTEIQISDTIQGQSSAATGVVQAILVLTGSWAGGDAAGYLGISDQTGTWINGETILVGVTDVATLGSVAESSIDTALTIKNVTTAYVVKDADDNYQASLTGAGVSTVKQQAFYGQGQFTSGNTTPSIAGSSVWATAEDAAGTNITDLTGEANASIIYLIGRGGTSPSVLVDSTDLRLAGNWTAAAYATITLLRDTVGDCWIELTRSAP